MQNWKTLGVVALMAAGFAASGCKSAPELTKDQAYRQSNNWNWRKIRVGMGGFIDPIPLSCYL
jgi:hypothetical protein